MRKDSRGMSAVSVCVREYPWGKQEHMARLGSHEPLYIKCNHCQRP